MKIEKWLGRHIAGQLVRCGTSAGPNYEEDARPKAAQGLRSQVEHQFDGTPRIAVLDSADHQGRVAFGGHDGERA